MSDNIGYIPAFFVIIVSMGLLKNILKDYWEIRIRNRDKITAKLFVDKNVLPFITLVIGLIAGILTAVMIYKNNDLLF